MAFHTCMCARCQLLQCQHLVHSLMKIDVVSCAHNISVQQTEAPVIFFMLLEAAHLQYLHRATDIIAMTMEAAVSSRINTASDGVTAFIMASYFVHEHIQDETIDRVSGDDSDDGDGDSDGDGDGDGDSGSDGGDCDGGGDDDSDGNDGDDVAGDNNCDGANSDDDGEDEKIGTNENDEVKEEGHSIISFSLLEMANIKMGLTLILILVSLIYSNAST